MKNFLLKTWLILVCLIVGSASAWAQTKTYQHVFNTKPSTGSSITLSGVKWDINATNLDRYNSSNYAGVQLGTSSKNGEITLKSANDWAYEGATKITEVRLWLNLGGSSVTPTVTIGGKTATSDGTEVVKNSKAGTDWKQASKVTFTPAEDGNTGVVNINIKTVNAGYICAMEIDCEAEAPKTLQSITLGGDYKTNYYVGETFKFEGTVTAKYDDNSTKDVTTNTEFSGYNLSTAGKQTVTASYTENDVTKTAIYGINVNEFTGAAGTYTITLNKDFYGIEISGNVEEEQSAKLFGVNVVSGCTSSATAKTYYSVSHIRYYANSYLKLTAPDGYVLTNVEIVPETGKQAQWDAAEGEISVSAGAYNLENKTWTGATSTLQFDFSKQCRVAAIVVTYEEAGNVEVPTLTSIEVTGTPEALWLNSEFNHNGITVNANWSNGAVTDVTNYCEFSGYNMSVAGDQTITVTYEGKTTTYTLTVKDNRFASLAALVAAGAPTAEGTPVTVTLTNDVIKSIFKTSKGDRNGIFLEANGQQVEIYCKDVPKEWAAGGTVSGTLTNCTWKLYGSKEPYTWELCPANWDELTYTAPAAPVLYTVTITTPEHGAIEVTNGEDVVKSGSQVEVGTTLTLTFTPEEGYELLGWTATDALGAHSFTDQKNTWTLNGDVNFAATFQKEKEPTWDLTKDQTTTASTSQLIWRNHKEVYMEVNKNRPDGPSATTNANNYYPGKRNQNTGELEGYTYTRFYKNSSLSIGPANGITISSIVITATTESYAKAYTSEQDGTEVRNATASRNGTVITLTPEDGKQEVVIVFGATASAISVDVVYSGEVIPEPDPVYYTITVDENIVGGTVSADRETAEEGDKVTLTASPEAGYKFASWNVHLAGSEENISVSNNVFVMPAGNVVVSAVFTSSSYTDENGNLIVTYDFNDKNAYPEDFPTKTGTTADAKKFVISNNEIIINAPIGYYQINPTNDDTRGLFFGKTVTENNNPKDGTAYLEFPAKENYKLVNVKAITVGGCAAGVAINIYDNAWKAYSESIKTVQNGTEEARTLSFDLKNTQSNTAYRLTSGSSSKNIQLMYITLTYAPADGGGTSYEGATIGTLARYIDGLLKGEGNIGEVKKIEDAILER